MRPLVVSKKRLSDRVLCFKVDAFIVRDTERFSVAGEARSRLRDTFSYGDLHLPPPRDATNQGRGRTN